MQLASNSTELFRHVSAEKAAVYRCIMDVFAAAKRQYWLQLRPDEVLTEARWPGPAPSIEEVNAGLAQLAVWGNLESHPDTSRVSSLSDFYRARFLYRLSQGGEAVESALAVFAQLLQRRAELQTVALEDITSRLQALVALAGGSEDDVAKLHEPMRDLVRVFEGLAENAQAFMAGVARSIELQQADAGAVANYKRRLIEYLERFMGEGSGACRPSRGGRTITADHLGSGCAPLMCTDGMPGAAQRTLLRQLAQAGASLHYHGDFDWPGLRIANHVIREHGARSWRLGATDYQTAIRQMPGDRSSLKGMRVMASWDEALTAAMVQHRIGIAEEALAGELLKDLHCH